MELGVYTFAELTSDEISPQERLRDLLEEIELADQVGLDVFGVGEHHRPDFAVSSPAVVLAAAAERTKTIRLSSAVTVLSSDDPVRVFQDFATLDLLSGGRAEIMAGRGSFIESFPLFGYDLREYDELFAEKLELLLRLRESEHVTWYGKHRPALDGLGVCPRPMQDRPRARLVAADAAGLRRVTDEAWRSVRRQPARDRLEDPLPARDLRTLPLSDPVQRRHDAARPDHARDRAARHRGRTRGARRA